MRSIVTGVDALALGPDGSADIEYFHSLATTSTGVVFSPGLWSTLTLGEGELYIQCTNS